MRHLLAALAVLLLSLGTAASSHALSLTIDPGYDPYTFIPDLVVGSTITITATLDTAGAPAGQIVDVTLNWDGAIAHALNATSTFTLGSSSQVITSGVNVGSSNLTSGGGFIPWTGPAQTGCVLLGGGAGNTCQVLNQANLSGSFVPDPAILVGTLQLQIDAVGLLGLDVTANAFGATPVIVPEPATAALLSLGLLGLAALRRRR